MVGEIRDLETAEIAIKAAQTGHLVLSTLHTNDAPKTLTRMVDMGSQTIRHRDLRQLDHRTASGSRRLCNKLQRARKRFPEKPC